MRKKVVSKSRKIKRNFVGKSLAKFPLGQSQVVSMVFFVVHYSCPWPFKHERLRPLWSISQLTEMGFRAGFG